jgi:hypothetical protein
MARLGERIKRMARSQDRYAVLTQPAFDGLAERTGARRMRIGAAIMAFVIVAIVLVAAFFGEKLWREGPLLWLGTPATAVVEQAELSEYSAKSGSPRYFLKVRYTFKAADGRAYRGEAERSSMATRFEPRAGEPIAIRYAASDPRRSTIEHNLAIDVYALVLFVPFLVLAPGALSALYLFRFVRWRRRL